MLLLQKADEWADRRNKADCKEVERRSRKDDKCYILSLSLARSLLLSAAALHFDVVET